MMLCGGRAACVALVGLVWSVAGGGRAPCTECPHYVDKKVFDTVRFLFIAGLEGTGHHSMSSIFAECIRQRRVCRHDRELGQLLHGNRSYPTGIFVYGRQAGTDLMALRKRFFTRLRTLRDAPRDRGKAILYLLNVNAKGATIPDAGMMSYPNFGEPNKVLHHPDMQTLAMMSEEAGADLRILAVQRDARDTLVSTAVHRLGEFPPWPEEAAVLANSAAALASELELVTGSQKGDSPFEGFVISGVSRCTNSERCHSYRVGQRDHLSSSSRRGDPFLDIVHRETQTLK